LPFNPDPGPRFPIWIRINNVSDSGYNPDPDPEQHPWEHEIIKVYVRVVTPDPDQDSIRILRHVDPFSDPNCES
jgi:hypothetical protein